MLGAPKPFSFYNFCGQSPIPISPLHDISDRKGTRAFRPVNIRETPASRTAKMSEQRNFTTRARLQANARRIGPLLKAPFRATRNAREIIVMSWTLKTWSNTTDSTRCNSGTASDGDPHAHSTNTDVSLEEQSTVSTTTPQEVADEPYHVFGNRMKWVVVAQIGVAGTFSGLSSNIYFPCLKTITKVNLKDYALAPGAYSPQIPLPEYLC